eukprot:TRINITY_DN5348_c2_g1_i1.p1 TRINITY_DN5348_c2_g1~~TRINITY_DN5348_c2_g1_i1.p1  ORF type:complete len:711 (+),score=65.59 TRINITY_DN5348_c2_g1_i1:266-2134(+)
MLPGFLKCLDAVDTPTVYYIATEECVSLADALTNSEFTGEETREEFIAYGTYCIIQALTHLHKRSLIHANCNRRSIYCTKSGDWKLWNLEFVTNISDSSSASYFKVYDLHLDKKYKPPELEQENWALIEKSPAHAVDAWGVACLLYEIFVGPLEDVEISKMKTAKGVPRSLMSSYTGLLAAQPKVRTNPLKLLTNCTYYSENTFIAVQKEIDELSLKDQPERDSFFRRLAGLVDTFPPANCKFTILPKLTTALQFGSGGASALEPILRIGEKLNESEYTTLVVPGVVQLFASPEPIIRIKLLQSIGKFAGAIPKHVLATEIWQYLVQGFTNKVPEIRELTIKAMISVVPSLNAALVDEVVKHLLKLQGDVEGGIRTNATICLGMIAGSLPAHDRSVTLHKAFSRMLKDRFSHSRVAGLGGYIATAEYFDPPLIAQGVLPSLTPCLVDAEKDVRVKAFKAVHAFVAKVEAFHESGGQRGPTTPSSQQPESPASNYMSWASGVVSKMSSSQGSVNGKPEISPTPSQGSQKSAARQIEPPVLSQQPVRQTPTKEEHSEDPDGIDLDEEDGWGASSSLPPTPPDTPVETAPPVAKPTLKKPAGGMSVSKMAPKPKKKGLSGARKMD